MKTFKVNFQNHHDRLANCYVTMNMQGKDLAHILPRIKRELKNLNSLPNPKSHTEFYLTEIKELTQNG